MFSHQVDQAELKKRITDVEELRQSHNQFRKLMEVKVKMLENENAARKSEVQSLIDFHKKLDAEVENLKAQIASCLSGLASQRKQFADLEAKLDGFINTRIDLGAKIADARKRLEKQDIVPKKAKTTK